MGRPTVLVASPRTGVSVVFAARECPVSMLRRGGPFRMHCSGPRRLLLLGILNTSPECVSFSGGVRVLRPPYAARMVLGTARGLRQLSRMSWWRSALVSGSSIHRATVSIAFHDPGAIAAGSLGVCFGVAVVRVLSRVSYPA